MPIITIQTGATLTDDTKTGLARALGEAITAIPGKSAANLMLAVHDGVFMAYDRNDGSRCLHMHVLLYQSAELAHKSALVERCTAIFVDMCGVEPACVYVTIQELDNWGVGGRYK